MTIFQVAPCKFVYGSMSTFVTWEWPRSILFNFRYISRSFSMAHLHTSPDVVLFLGDLMDEGSTSTDEEYEITYKRFQEVFIDAVNTKVSSQKFLFEFGTSSLFLKPFLYFHSIVFVTSISLYHIWPEFEPKKCHSG